MSECKTKRAFYFVFILIFLSVIFCFSCLKQEVSKELNEDDFTKLLSAALVNANLPQYVTSKIEFISSYNEDFKNDLLYILNDDPEFRLLVDKQNPLDSEYEPDDVVNIYTGSSLVSNYMLQRAAHISLAQMKEAAEKEGITITVLSAFRSYFYQSRTYTYYVITMGQEEADKISARPGFSQHQLGLAVDFNMLENDLAKTPEGLWLAANASRFGWSLSYPDGYENVTGYTWESWHYRYVGKKLSGFIDTYFNGIQQYALMFIDEFLKLSQRS